MAKIFVFGANGKVGSLFVEMAVKEEHALTAFVRSRSRFSHPALESLQVYEGDATNLQDVRQAIQGAEIITSFWGNPNKQTLIMAQAAQAISQSALESTTTPRCLMISSVGVGGSSWLIKRMLRMIGGKKGFQDYEDAEKVLRNASDLKRLIVRPYALKDAPSEVYKILGAKAHLANSISRRAVARFFLDAVQDTQFDGPHGVNIGGA